MAFLHVLREASRLLDEGATYSHAGAVGTAEGWPVAVRLAQRADAPAGAEPTPWCTVVEVSLAGCALEGFSLCERDDHDAALVRADWVEGGLAPERFFERFTLVSPAEGDRPARGAFSPSGALATRCLEHPPFSASTRAVAGGAVLEVVAPDFAEGEDLERQLALALHLAHALAAWARA